MAWSGNQQHTTRLISHYESCDQDLDQAVWMPTRSSRSRSTSAWYLTGGFSGRSESKPSLWASILVPAYFRTKGFRQPAAGGGDGKRKENACQGNLLMQSSDCCLMQESEQAVEGE